MSALVDERECLNERILFFNALQLLGFDACEQRRQHRVEFGADMFCKSNPRGLLVVLHFLFAAKDPEETKKDFAHAWPALDRLQDREFKAIALRKLKELERTGELPRGTTRKSHLSTGFGPGIYTIVWRLADHVLRLRLRALFPHAPIPQLPDPSNMSLQLLDAHLKALKSTIVQQDHEILSKCAESIELVTKWQSYIALIADQYRQASADLREAEDARERFESTVEPDVFTELAQLKRQNEVQQHQQHWNSLKTFYEESKAERDVIEYVLDSEGVRFRVDGNALRGLITGQDQEHGHEDAVDLAELITRWNDSMENFLHAFPSTEEEPELGATAEGMQSRLQTQANELNNVENLNSRIERLLPDIAAQNSELIEQLHIMNANSPLHLSGSIPSSTLSTPRAPMQLVPPTPAVVTRSFNGTVQKLPHPVPVPVPVPSNRTKVVPLDLHEKLESMTIGESIEDENESSDEREGALDSNQPLQFTPIKR